MKKGNILAALFAVVALFGTVFALNPTVFSDLKATNLQITTLYDNAGPTARFTPGSTNAITGNITVSGSSTLSGTVAVTTMTVAAAQAIRFSPNFITVGTDVPASTGTIAFSSTWVLYVATGTGNALQWVKIGSQ